MDQYPQIASVEPNSAASRAGLQVLDRVISIQGVVPRDILEWHRLVENDVVALVVLRGNEEIEIEVSRNVGEPFGAGINSAVFDRIHTCDNHCEFCFIYQLPKGMRRSLYLKDDDYRLSFLFGNFTTLTRFTEADLERVIEERLSPLYVSVHSTHPRTRSEMLRNVRGGISLRWLKILLDHDIHVRAQIVLCPGVNDKEVLEHTLGSMLEEFTQLESIAIVPLGLSKFNSEDRMRVHTHLEANEVINVVEKWQARFYSVLGRQPIHLADEFYLVADRDIPVSEHYGEFPMLEDGVGLVRSFIDSFTGKAPERLGKADGFFASVDVSNPTDYVRPVNPAADSSLRPASVAVKVRNRKFAKKDLPCAVVTGEYGAKVIRRLLAEEGFSQVPVIEVKNDHFGGNTAVAGLMTYEDVRRALSNVGEHCFLLPDVCLNDDVFLDGGTVHELSEQFTIEVLPTSGLALRERLNASQREASRV